MIFKVSLFIFSAFLCINLYGGKSIFRVTMDDIFNKNLYEEVNYGGKTVLKCSGKEISSLEGIERFNLDTYDELDLTGNHIESIKELSKVHNETIKVISLNNNALDYIEEQEIIDLGSNFSSLTQVNLDGNLMSNLIEISALVKFGFNELINITHSRLDTDSDSEPESDSESETDAQSYYDEETPLIESYSGDYH